MNDIQAWGAIAKDLSVVVVSICAVAFVLGKWADAYKAKWSK